MPHPSFSAAPTPSEGCVPLSPAPVVAADTVAGGPRYYLFSLTYVP